MNKSAIFVWGDGYVDRSEIRDWAPALKRIEHDRADRCGWFIYADDNRPIRTVDFELVKVCSPFFSTEVMVYVESGIRIEPQLIADLLKKFGEAKKRFVKEK